MYFDAVIFISNQHVLFNGTPQETKEFLNELEESIRDAVYVSDGETLNQWTVQEYLAR